MRVDVSNFLLLGYIHKTHWLRLTVLLLQWLNFNGRNAWDSLWKYGFLRNVYYLFNMRSKTSETLAPWNSWLPDEILLILATNLPKKFRMYYEQMPNSILIENQTHKKEFASSFTSLIQKNWIYPHEIYFWRSHKLITEIWSGKIHIPFNLNKLTSIGQITNSEFVQSLRM